MEIEEGVISPKPWAVPSQLYATFFKSIPLVTILRTNKPEIRQVEFSFGTRALD